MSGGSFDFAYSKVTDFADELSARLDTEPAYPHSEVVRERLQRLVIEARKLAALMRETEWLYSGDHGEQTYLDLVEKIDAGTGA